MSLRSTLLCAMALGLAMPVAVRADDEKGKNTIKAMAKFKGAKPSAKQMEVTSDPYCAKSRSNKPVAQQSAFVGPDDSLPYVIVYVKSGAKGKYTAPKDPIVIDQSGCMYKPHVQCMVAGQPIEIRNSDDTTHNIHAKPKKNSEFNISQPKKGLVAKREGKETFNKPEFVEVKCDVHSWMSCYIGVFEHPFFGVTNFDPKEKKGVAAELKELPDGDYEVEAWHPMWGTTAAQKVTIKGGEAKEVEFVFEKKQADAGKIGDIKTVSSADANGKTGEDIVKLAKPAHVKAEPTAKAD